MLPLLLFAILAAAPIWAGEDLVPVSVDRVEAGSPVRLRLRPDTLPIGYAGSGRVLLMKRKDSAYVTPDKRMLVISELAIRRAGEVLPVTGETWDSRQGGTARISLGFRDVKGNADSLQARIETADIERAFLRVPIPELAASKNSGGSFFPIFAAALSGGAIGILYGKLHKGQDGSMPGSAAFFYGLGGMLIGLFYGVQFSLLDG